MKIINNTTNLNRYSRREETKNVLEYVHGGRDELMVDGII